MDSTQLQDVYDEAQEKEVTNPDAASKLYRSILASGMRTQSFGSIRACC